MVVRTAVLIGIIMAAVAAVFCPLSVTDDNAEGDALCTDFINERRSTYRERTYASKTGYRFIGDVSNEAYYEGCSALKVHCSICVDP